MKYLSVCAGIEAASVAWHCLGWEPLALSEIEAFPRAVLAHHHPNVPLHGDFTKLRDEAWIMQADILVGGTPCQAFSVAGLRNSLSDDRGNLTLEFVRLADAIDDLRHADGREPAIIVWENVPGVLSVKDNAFGCFLAGLAGDVDPYDPPRGKWTNAGMVAGPKRAVAWRVLDAQYFGLAQRRRRVFVVASARAGFDPAAVLLEFEGVRRDTPPRREKGQAASGGASGRAGERSHWDGVDHPHPTLNQSAKSSGGVGASNQELFLQRGAYLVGGVAMEDPVPPLMARSSRGGAQTLSPGHQTDGHMVAVEQPYQVANCLTARMHKGINSTLDEGQTPVVTHSLRAEGFDASEDGTGRGTPLVPVAYPINTQIALRHNALGERTGMGIGDTEDPAFTLQAGHSHAVAYAFQPRIARNGRGDMGEVVNALTAEAGETGKGDAAPCVAVGFNWQNAGGYGNANEGLGITIEGTGPLQRCQTPAVAQHMAVRRLTPVECERLQGFPDNYTNIPWRGKPEAPDGPRYKALGNSMAVPVMAWIGRRIAAELARTQSQEQAA